MAAQKVKGTFCLRTQMNLGDVCLALLEGASTYDFDFDQVGTRSASGACFGIHAAGRNQFGLGELVRRKDFEDGGKVLIGKLVGVTTEQAANIATGETAAAGDVALVELPPLGLALEGNAEVAHGGVDSGWLIVEGVKAVGRVYRHAYFFVLRVPCYATLWGWQQGRRGSSWVQILILGAWRRRGS